jgi:signal transduction histidine kinase
MNITEIQLTKLSIPDDKLQQIELHSFLNVINLINMKLSLISLKLNAELELGWVLDATIQIAAKVKDGDSSVLYPNHVNQYCEMVVGELEKLQKVKGSDASVDLQASINLLNEFFVVFRSRSSELLSKMLYPGKWEALDIDEYKDEYHKFFMAVERNSDGRYRIIYNIARQEEKDYLVQLDVESDFGNYLYMPLSFKDVIRDLIANSRKYTPPGGQLDIGIFEDTSMLRFSIQDNGIGIPHDELTKIFDFGYRASNVMDKATMGGGFGLTKAAYVTKQLGGRIFISSTVGKGTRIRIEIPIPTDVLHHIKSHI